MAHKTVLIKHASQLFKSSRFFNRLLHKGATESTIQYGMEGDIMGESLNQPHGMNTNTVEEPEASSEVKNHDDPNMIPDPNISMWNTCKKTNESPGKKLKINFRKLKHNIKDYYVGRLEENEILFTEIEEPFKIGKLNKKERSFKYKESKEEMEPMVEEVQPPMMRAAMRERMNLMKQNQTNPEENLEGISTEESLSDEIMPEQGPPRRKKEGYKQFNRLAYASKPENMKTRNAGVLVKSSNLEGTVTQTEQNNLQKIPQDNNEKIYARGNGGLSDIRGIPTTINFKADVLGTKTKHLLSMIMIDQPYRRTFSTCMIHQADDSRCKPLPLKPKTSVCEPGTKLPKCPKDEFKWPSCPKITLCGCDPPSPRVNKGECDVKIPIFPYDAKRPDFICPSFSECKRNTKLIQSKPTECCRFSKTCSDFVGPRKPFVTAMERQEISLGQKYWSSESKRAYHASSRQLLKAEECVNTNSKALPCHKPAQEGQKIPENQAGCEKICMPCCKPARNPPTCDSSMKPSETTCIKIENPRPSFSECKKMFTMKQSVCECDVISKPKCPEKKC